MKKVLSVLMCFVMLFAMSIPAFAVDVTDKPYEDSKFCEIGDYTIHYREWKADNEKGQIFMIHGFALSSYCWVNLAEILVENGYTCVMADLPDFGYSSRETKDTNMIPREDIMHTLMKKLSDKPWYVAGHSMGGFVSLKLAEKYPDDVKNLLLFGTSGNDPKPEFMTKMMTNDTFINIMGPVLEKAGQSKALVKLILIAALSNFKYAVNYDVDEVCNPYKISGTGKGALYSFSMLPETNYDAVKSFSPILYVNGSKDMIIPDSMRVNLRASLPEGSIDCVINKGGHMLIEDRADEVAEVTLEFLLTH